MDSKCSICGRIITRENFHLCNVNQHETPTIEQSLGSILATLLRIEARMEGQFNIDGEVTSYEPR